MDSSKLKKKNGESWEKKSVTWFITSNSLQLIRFRLDSILIGTMLTKIYYKTWINKYVVCEWTTVEESDLALLT